MWDGWEAEHGCLRRIKAEVRGHRRVFNKASVRNWGTRERPCPTLNLEKSEGSHCIGIAFEFSDDREVAVRAYLAEREGKGFTLHTLAARSEANDFEAIVPIYRGRNLTRVDNAEDVVRAILQARGSHGTCVDYIKGIADELRRLEIDDTAVSDLWSAVEQSHS